METSIIVFVLDGNKELCIVISAAILSVNNNQSTSFVRFLLAFFAALLLHFSTSKNIMNLAYCTGKSRRTVSWE